MECPCTFQRYRALQELFKFSRRAAQQEPGRRSSAWNFRAVKFTGEIKHGKAIKTIKTAKPINPKHKIWRGSIKVWRGRHFQIYFQILHSIILLSGRHVLIIIKVICLNRRKPG